MSHKSEIVDEDGNIIKPPPPDSDVAHLIYLLEWGRARGFRIGPMVTVGQTTVQIVDVRQANELMRGGRTPELDPDSDMATVLNG